MNKPFGLQFVIAASVACLLTPNLFAQSDLDDEINSELERIYAQQNGSSGSKLNRDSGSQVQVNVNAAPVASNSTESGLGTYQNAGQSTGQYSGQSQVAPQSVAPQTVAPISSTNLSIQKQPTTYIEATPLQESRAEMLRKSRQDAEVSTEQKIVEKLEFSRLEDEKRRSDVLFGDRFQQIQSTQNQQVIVPVQVQEQVVAPVKVVQAEPVDKDDLLDDEEIIRSEVRASMAEMNPPKPPQVRYFSGGVGIAEYMNANNVKNNYSIGFGVGSRVSERLLVEGSFTYGSFQIQQRDGVNYCDYYACGYFPRITDMDQYTGSAVAKYQIFNGLFRPVFGGVLSYNYRTFSDSQFAIANNDAQTHSLDLGMVAGADVELSPEFSLGLEFKYMFLNFFNRNTTKFSRGFSQSVYGSDTPIERMNQMTISVMGRATF